jgi:DNA invertase Pin-like site-specific DNA recombinase
VLSSSGTETYRKEIRALLHTAEEHQIRAVLVTRFDRLHRDSLELGRLAGQLKALGVRIISARDGIYDETLHAAFYSGGTARGYLEGGDVCGG